MAAQRTITITERAAKGTVHGDMKCVAQVGNPISKAGITKEEFAKWIGMRITKLFGISLLLVFFVIMTSIVCAFGPYSNQDVRYTHEGVTHHIKDVEARFWYDDLDGIEIEIEDLNKDHAYVAYTLTPNVNRTHEEVLKTTEDKVCPRDYEHIIDREICGWKIDYDTGIPRQCMTSWTASFGNNYEYSKYETYEVRLYRFNGKVNRYSQMVSGSFTLLESVKFGPIETRPTPTPEPTPTPTFEPTPTPEPTVEATTISVTYDDEDFKEWAKNVESAITLDLQVISTGIEKDDSETMREGGSEMQKDANKALLAIDNFDVSPNLQAAKTEFRKMLEESQQAGLYMQQDDFLGFSNHMEKAADHSGRYRDLLKTPEPTIESTSTSGFKAIFAIAGILAVAYIALRRR